MTRRINSDRGAVALIVALCLVVLCGLAALAVDIGFGFRERRFDQAGSDSAALGGSLEMVITNQANPVQAAIDTVYQLVDVNLGRSVPLADWSACVDAGALFWRTKTHASTLGTTNGSDCISLSQNFNTFRVRVPLQGVDTTFGRVMGFDEFDVTAVAEAQRNTNWGGGGDFPSGVLSGTDAGATICIKTGTSGGADSCGEPTSGDFGNFRPYFYGPVDGSLASLCVSGEASVPMARAMADGIDHELSAYNPISPNPRVNGQWCQTSSVPGPPFPNIVDSAAGYHNDDITQGLITGGNWPSSAFSGRLTRGPYATTSAQIFGFSIDNRPLWDYIDDAAAVTISMSCVDAGNRPATISAGDYPAAMAEMRTCINDAVALGTPLFTTDILNTHRLAHSPLFHETALAGNNADPYHIKGIVPIFIQSVYAKSEHVTFTCTGFDTSKPGMCIHHPGLVGDMGVGPKGLQKVDSASAIVLSCSILPSGTCPTIQDGTNPLNFLYDLQLTR
jgi:hypothetical protein